LKEYDKAEIAYQVAIKNSTGEPLNMLYYRNYYDFARLYLKDSKKAEQIVLQAVEDNLGSQDVYVLAGQFYRDSGNKTKALQYFQKALTFDPTDELLKQEIERLK
jgi:tetratricopeptide (TPR) repeat protein